VICLVPSFCNADDFPKMDSHVVVSLSNILLYTFVVKFYKDGGCNLDTLCLFHGQNPSDL
jgi:hypothetical protein